MAAVVCCVVAWLCGFGRGFGAPGFWGVVRTYCSSSVSLSNAVGRTGVDCAGGSGVSQRSPLLFSSPPECLSLLAKLLSNLLPTVPLDFPSLHFLGLPLGGDWAHGGFMRLGLRVLRRSPLRSVPHPSGSLSSQKHSRISFRPQRSIPPRFSSTVCPSEAIGRTWG